MTTAGGVLAPLAGAVGAVQGVAWWRTGDDELEEVVVELERQAARLEAARLRALAEAEARGLAVRAGARTTGAWLAHRTGFRAERAEQRIAEASALYGPSATLAVTGAALAAGDLTGDHAAVVHRVVTALPAEVDEPTRAEAERFLVAASAQLGPRELARAGAVLRHRLDVRGGEQLAQEEDDQVERSEVRMSQADDGRWLLSGVLAPVEGATLHAALDEAMAPRPAAGASGARDTRPAPRRRAEALVRLAEGYLASREGLGSSRPRVVVTVPLQTVAQPSAPGRAPGLLSGGAPVSAATVGLLACDAEVLPVLVGPEGQPLDVGRSVYAWPEKLRRAIRHRDQRCTFAGCTAPAAWTQIHHLTAYSEGGSTSERNGACLCGYHHRLVHRQGWRGELVGSQVVWHPPGAQDPVVPPPPWLPALDRLVARWAARWAGPAAA